jgi:glycosyltransferase involved in cell wall biosynthesis
MNKVLFIGPLGETGGVAKYTKDLMAANLKFNIVLFNISRLKTTPKYKVIGYKAFIDLGVSRLIRSFFITIFNMIRFPFVLIFKNPNIIHIGGTSYFMFWEKSFYILISKLFRKKVLLHFLGALDQYYNSAGNTEKKYIRFILKKTDKLALLSDKVKVVVKQFVPEEKLIVIRSSVDISKFFESDVKMDFYNNQFTDFLFLGGADPKRKGLDVIVRAIPLVLKENPNVRFIFTGNKIINASIEELIKQENRYISNLIYLGWVDENDKYSVYRSVNAFLLPSFNEGLPYTIIEAIAAKLPVIATPVGGIPEVIQNGVNGFLIDFDDHVALSERILEICINKELSNTIAQNNYEKAESDYSLITVFNQLEAIYTAFSIKKKY